jgi:hypothetical protein
VGFSQATITEVFPPQLWGGQIAISWTSSSPSGTWFQLYLERQLSWWGQVTNVRLAIPQASPVRIDIGTVLPGEEQTDFSSSLPAAPQPRANLSWLGGTFEGADIAGFKVFGGDVAGASVDFSIVLADIAAYPGGFAMDGFGLGGFGYGGFGESAGAYAWTSDPLLSGTWNFAVVPYDTAGNLGTPATTSVVIAVPPTEPPYFPDGLCLHYTYSSSTHEITLLWNESTG